jgi:hypothetical protein
MELPRTSCAGPARETFSLNPHHFGACREGLTAGRGYHCATRRLPWRWRISVPVKPETLRTCTQADTLPKDCRRLRAQRCPCHWQNLQSTRKTSGRRCYFLGSGVQQRACAACRRIPAGFRVRVLTLPTVAAKSTMLRNALWCKIKFVQ